MLKELSAQRKGPGEENAIRKLGYESKRRLWAVRRNELLYKILSAAAQVAPEDTFRLKRKEAEVIHMLLFNLETLAPDYIKEAILLARNTEDFYSELKLLDAQKILIPTSILSQERKKQEYDAIHKRENELLELMGEVRSFRQLLENITASPAHFTIDSPEVASSLGKVVNNTPKPAGSFRAKIYQHKILFALALYSGDITSAIFNCNLIQDIFQNNKSLYGDPELFTIAYKNVQNLGLFLLSAKRFEEADQAIAGLEELNIHKTNPALFFELQFIYQIKLVTEKLASTKAEQIIRWYNKNLEKYQSEISELFIVQSVFLISKFYLLVGNPTEAAYWTLKNFKNKLGTHRPILIGFARILFLISKFELGSMEEVIRYVKSARNHFQKTGFENEYTDCILDNFELAARLVGKERIKALNRFQKELAVLNARPVHIQLSSLYDLHLQITAWLEGKPISNYL